MPANDNLTAKTNSNPEGLVPALGVKDLSFYYGTRKALEGVSMDVYEGHVTAIIGPSG